MLQPCGCKCGFLLSDRSELARSFGWPSPMTRFTCLTPIPSWLFFLVRQNHQGRSTLVTDITIHKLALFSSHCYIYLHKPYKRYRQEFALCKNKNATLGTGASAKEPKIGTVVWR